MTSRARCPLISVFALALAPALGAQDSIIAARRAEFVERAVDSILTAALAAHGIPGLSVAVVRGGDVIISRGYGLADREAGTRADARTVYQIGSISKQFTAAGVMRLAERGVLRLDDALSRHLPEYRPRGDSVRLRHLLHQTSGIFEEFMLPGYGELIVDTARTTAELIALIERQPLGFAAGSRWSYSNSNYTLLAAVIERVTGRPYERVLAEELFAPLGLTSLRQCPTVRDGPNQARGYAPADGGRVEPSTPENMRWIRGDGGLCATAEDLARWARALARGRAVRADSYRRMTTTERLGDGTRPDYGFALSLVPMDGRVRKVSHGGRMAGFTGTLAYYPEHDVAVAILTNRAGVWIEPVEAAVARAVLGLPAPATPAARETSLGAAERRRLTGTYDIGVAGMPVRVAERDGVLWLEMLPPGPSSALRHLGRRAFAADSAPDGVRVTFPRGTTRPDRLVMLMAGMHWYGRRIDDSR